MVHNLTGDEHQLLERLGAAIVVMDSAGVVVHWNADAERILGLPASQALNQPWTSLVTVVRGGDISGREAKAAARRAGGWHGLTQLQVGVGAPCWVSAHVQAITLGPDRPAMAAVFWAADSGEGDEEPADTRLPYVDLFRLSPEALFLTDLDATIIEANDAGATMFGFERAQMAGRSLPSHAVGWTEADTDAARAELLASGSILREFVTRNSSGESFAVELISTILPPTEAGLALVRLRDMSHDRRLEKMLRDLGTISRTEEEEQTTEDVARKALDIISTAWATDGAVAVAGTEEGRLAIAGSATPEALTTLIRSLDPERLDLGSSDQDAGEPAEVNLLRRPILPDWAVAATKMGVQVVQTAPLWFGDNRVGTLFLLWNDVPAIRFDAATSAQVGRHVGLVIGNADLRETMRRDAALRASLEGSARVGGVVVAQMTDTIFTLDTNGKITAVNPAGERQYGITAEDVIGLIASDMVTQLGLDGEPVGSIPADEARKTGYWSGRLIHKPRIGSRAGVHMLVDMSLTAIYDGRHRPTGLIAMGHEVAPSDHMQHEAAVLSSLAVATSRARNRHEVAAAALERLAESTIADAGLIVSWSSEGIVVEASRGLSQETIAAISEADVPSLGPALELPGAILPVESLAALLAGTELEGPFQREGLVTGVLMDLRTRDKSIGMMALAARRPAWGRPSDAVLLQAAAQVANSMSSAQLTERLEEGLGQERRLTAQLETLMGLTLLPGAAVTEEDVARFLIEKVVGALGAGGGFAVRVTEDRLRVVASFQMPPEMMKIIEDRPARRFPFWQRVVDSPDGRAFQEPTRDLGPTDDTEMRRAGITSYAIFPVREADKTLGALMCYFTGANDTIAQTDDRTIDAVGRTISIAYANARMSEGLAEAAEHERRLTAELQALQELTLLGAQTDDLGKLAQETIEAVVLATGASGGGYILVDTATPRVDPIKWVGQPSSTWAVMSESPTIPPDWPPFERLMSDEGIWLSRPDADSSADGGVALVAQAVLPLRVGDRLAGVLNLEWHGSDRAEQFDVHFLEPIARICSISLANFRLRSELLHRAAAQRALGHRLDTLDELTRIGEEASSFEELAHRTVSLVREALGASGVCYLLIEPGHHFETHAVAGETGAFRLWLKGVPAKDAPGGSLLLSGGSSVLGDFSASQVNERVLPLARATGFRSFAAVPIRTGEELAGALLCFFEQSASALPLDESALDSVARIAGIALANFRLRERLVSSEERYRTLFEESPDALLVTALDGTVLDANEAAVRMYRVNRGEVLGRYLGQLISADEREMARRRQIVWAQGRGGFKDRGRRPDGTEFPLEVEIRVVELGGQRRFLHLVRDLSDQERLTRELLQAQKMEAIGQLVSGVAHELNNPLAAIIAFSQLLRSDNRLPEDMKHDAGLLVQEADRTRRIVQNLLDFARARLPERRPTSIRTLVNSVLELQSYALGTSQIQVTVTIPESLPEVDLDRAQLQQVLLNLTINAIQAMRTRDRKSPANLWVTAALVRSRAMPTATRNERQTDEQRVRITIRDDGPGVPESARARLFDPFFTTKQPGEGTGLGLSVSFGIVAAHGGHLWYEPGPGGIGSSFVVELPVSSHSVDDRGLMAALTGEVGSVVTGQAPNPTAQAAPMRPPEPIPVPQAHDAGRPARAPQSRPTPPDREPGNGAASNPAQSTEAAGADPTTSLPASGRPEVMPPPRPEAVPAASPHAATVAPAPVASVAESVLAQAASVPPATPTAAAVAADSPSEAEPPPATRRPRILVLDDEPSIRAFLRKALTAQGMDVLVYEDGAAAWEGIRSIGNFDVMLIDHRMAGMSGTEFYEAAVELLPEVGPRAVFMSGDVLNPELSGFAMQRGIRLLAKPFDIDAVIRIVREVLAATGAACQ